MRITLILLLLIFVCCKKENCRNPDTVLDGKVIDSKTKMPIQNAKVILVWRRSSSYIGGRTDMVKIKDEKTNSDGNFILSFCKDEVRKYYLSFSKRGYHSSENHPISAFLPNGPYKVVELEPK